MLSAAAYGGGLLAVVTVLVAVGLGSASARRALVPAWTGSSARLAELTIALSVLLTVAQVLGALHAFRPIPMLSAAVVAGVAMIAVGRRASTRPSRREPEPQREARTPPRSEVTVVAIGVALVAVQWASHVAHAFRHGMTHSDTLWYHAPFAARFLQHGGFDDLGGVGLEAARLYPLNGSLVHALGMLAFDRDLLSPLFNLGWMLVALLAAWCIGRRSGRPHLCVLAMSVVLGLPMMTATQPGQAATDTACLALLLVAVALLLESDLEPAPLALAGLALGLSISTKLAVAAPGAVLLLGVAVLAWRNRGRLAAGVWSGAVLATGSFWFVRNWIRVGSPLPWYDLRVGPVGFPVHEAAAASVSGQPALAKDLTSSDAWRLIFVPGLWQSLGRAWPVVVALLVVALVVVARRGSSLERVIAAAAATGAVAYVFTPFTGGFNFFSGLRFLAPSLAAAAVLVVTKVPDSQRWRSAVIATAGALVIVNASMPNRERVPAWPLVGPTLAVVAVAALLGCALWRARVPSVRATLAVASAALVVTGGWFVQRQFFDHRYVDTGLGKDLLDEHFRDVRGARVAVVGTDDTYPLFGADLSNDVRRADEPAFDFSSCAAWRERLSSFDYVAVATVTFGFYVLPPPEVFATDAFTFVEGEGATSVYRVDGPLDPSTCPR